MSNKAYSGKYVKVQGASYQLVPELIVNGCKGCAFENTYNCHTLGLTDNCRQRFIYKKVKL